MSYSDTNPTGSISGSGRPARRESVADLVAAAFPGVSLESDVQGWAFLERFEEGVAAYASIEAPSPQDDRWVGVCYYQMVRDNEALEALYRAVSRGDEGARVNIAHLLPFLERADEASRELSRVNFDRLSSYDQALYFRVQSIRSETSGKLREALQAAEEAWKRIQRIPEGRVLAPSVLAQLAVLHGRIGRSQRAIWFLERGMSTTVGQEQLKFRLRRSAVLVVLGRYQEARGELDTIASIAALDNVQAERTYLLGEISLALGNLRSAVQYYVQAIDYAVRLQFKYEELLCRLALASIQGSRGDFFDATKHLERAHSLVSDKVDRLVYRFREVLLMLWQRNISESQALEELDELVEAFGQTGLLQEQACVRLHKANLLRVTGFGDFRSELDELQAISVSLQNPALVHREWVFLPELHRIALTTHPRIAGQANSVIEVLTLGEERLVLDGKSVTIPLKGGVQLLAYFLEKKAVDLETLLADAFPGEKERTAKSYFHQFRSQLRDSVPGLSVDYDSDSRMYHLRSEIDILWDVAELRAGRTLGVGGTFLPDSTCGWARDLAHELAIMARDSAPNTKIGAQ
ncbi:MAG: hypothetical protein KF813_02815 [Trueperaceae bacterium]|nr:hypothetical protein [Trueperaceae bacterium]